jgi:nicotinate-nucleotide adenylyltransferase
LKQIALFGGSFDPVHIAHVALAQAALAALAVDELRWLPAGHAWQKGGAAAPAADREAMVRLAIDGEPRFTLERLELEGRGATYTVDTVRALQAREPGCRWFLVIGADQHAGLHTWHGWPELLQRVTLAVAGRADERRPPDAAVARHPVRHVPLAAMAVSSSDIRRRVAAGEDVSALVPPGVAGYIARRGLYRNDKGTNEN